MKKYFTLLLVLIAFGCSDDTNNPIKNDDRNKGTKLPITKVELITYVNGEVSDNRTIEIKDSVYTPSDFKITTKHNVNSRILKININNVPNEKRIDIDYRSIIEDFKADSLVYGKNDNKLLFSVYANYKYDQRHYVAVNSELYIDKIDTLNSENIYISGKVEMDLEKNLNTPKNVTLLINFENLLVEFVDEEL